ncbi:ABC transporter substrate-binding protein [bacterium]|nr:ABC transporter substrate-binding protein [bacterium]
MKKRNLFIGGLFSLLACAALMKNWQHDQEPQIPVGRSEVIFWHFWGGEDRDVVDDVARRFNASQTEYYVRPIAMPGNNLQAKLFLAVAGGDPPDIVNQDDPILADWGQRGVIQPLEDIAPASEVAAMEHWMLDSARRLSTYQDKMYGLCNGLDIRALYYNKTLLEQHNLQPPQTISDLNEIANALAPFLSAEKKQRYGYIPDSRRLWAWGYVFGGDFYDASSQRVVVDSPPIRDALQWMASYAQNYGADNLAAFRKGDQSLPGKTFPLLPRNDQEMSGRYAVIMDGQWRVRNLAAFTHNRQARGVAAPEFGVCPLPVPNTSAGRTNAGRTNAGWVNGNFFVFPQGAKNPQGAWEFAKFWVGYSNPSQAAQTCSQGGWIPVSKTVTQDPQFQNYLDENPLFRTFIELSESPNQFPIPSVAGAAFFRRTIEQAAFQAFNNSNADVDEILQEAEQQIQTHLNRNHDLRHGGHVDP